MTITKSKKFRDHHGKVLLEGHRLIKDALEAGAVPHTLFFSTMGHLKELPEAKLKQASLVKVKFEDIKSWSDLVTPQGLIGKLLWKWSQYCSKGNLFKWIMTLPSQPSPGCPEGYNLEEFPFLGCTEDATTRF